ncbi:MAG: DUF1566 domain-containing protein [Hydrogenophaga sp.]|nr:DUF1566 domain-containing protein [Hydrogenophaga sp.]
MQAQKITFPELQEGETHLCAFVNKDGSVTHTILLKDTKENTNWQDAMEWAKELGGDLPSRAELILLYENHKDQFEERAYWSNTQHASNSNYAWSQYFNDGSQDGTNKGSEFRARAVRRLVIQ